MVRSGLSRETLEVLGCHAVIRSRLWVCQGVSAQGFGVTGGSAQGAGCHSLLGGITSGQANSPATTYWPSTFVRG